MGLGVFAMEDIVVSDHCPVHLRPDLFPFSGVMYSRYEWGVLSRQCSTFGRYALGLRHDPSTYAFLDGYPPRAGGLAGYINSSTGLSRRLGRPMSANAEWVEIVAGHRLVDPSIQYFVMTCATRTIRAGDEILVDYTWRRTWQYTGL
jgi:hypothetical protein